MSNMPRPDLAQEVFRQITQDPVFSLDPTFNITRVREVSVEEADDGRGVKAVFTGERSSDTRKSATFETGSFLDNGGVEGAPDRHDICVSTAGGCTRSCTFCAVPISELGFERLLTPVEIVFQALYMMALRNANNEMPNVIGLMGNGEPIDNMRGIVPAIVNLANKPEIDRITVSTIGEHIKGIYRLGEIAAGLPPPVKLQFSLIAADPEKRRLVIPGNVPMEAMMRAVDAYAEITNLPVKFNVVLINGSEDGQFAGFTNASAQDAIELARLLLSPSYFSGKPILRRLKLSSYNPIPGIPFVEPSENERSEFVATVQDYGIEEIKTFQGSGISIDQHNGSGGFACGQLRANTPVLLKQPPSRLPSVT